MYAYIHTHIYVYYNLLSNAIRSGSPPPLHENLLDSNPLRSRFRVCGLAVQSVLIPSICRVSN